MAKYITTRLCQAIITCWLLVTMVFFFTRLAGDPTIWLIGPKIQGPAREAMLVRYGLNGTQIEQYFRYLLHVIKGDFGMSFYYGRPALDIIMERVPNTLLLTGSGLLLAIVIGIPVGVYSAVKKGSVLDTVSRGVAFFCISAPSFWVGIMLISVFSLKLGWFSAGGMDQGLRSLFLPALTVSLSLIGGFLRLSRSGMLEVLGTDYVRMARAKGVPWQRTIWKHGFKNASIPIVTNIMLQFVVVLSGDVAVENIFSWNGLGRLIMDSVYLRDYTVIQAFTILIGFAFVILSMICDVIYAYVDPKIRK